MRQFASALYYGAVLHRRTRPARHRLRYRVFSMLIDLDELPLLDRSLRFFSYNRFNIFSFQDRDHGSGERRPLRAHIEAVLKRHGIDIDGGAIRLLCMPRILGYVFNPLSVYFCYGHDGKLVAILYEVSNTFGERHNYLIEARGNTGQTISQTSKKNFHVSPFLPLDLQYRFRIAPPAGTTAVSVHVHDKAGLILSASLSGERMELTNRALYRTFMLYPLLTLKVVGGIHWEALKLWRKGVKVHTKPSPPELPVTVGREEASEAKVQCLHRKSWNDAETIPAWTQSSTIRAMPTAGSAMSSARSKSAT